MGGFFLNNFHGLVLFFLECPSGCLFITIKAIKWQGGLFRLAVFECITFSLNVDLLSKWLM